MGKQGETATNKDNNINIIKGLIYSGIPSNMACFCKLMAQNWHKNFALVRASSGFTWRVSDCEELVGHLGIYSPNYFMYDKRGQCAPPYPSLLKFRQILHLN